MCIDAPESKTNSLSSDNFEVLQSMQDFPLRPEIHTPVAGDGEDEDQLETQ